MIPTDLLPAELLAQVEAALKGKGKDGKDTELGIVNDGSLVVASKLEEALTAKKQLETDIKTRDAQLKELGATAKGSEELSKTIQQLQEENAKKDREYQEKVSALAIESAARLKFKEAGAKYEDLLMGKLDRAALKVLENNAVTGLDEQIAAMKTTYGELFAPAVSGKKPPAKTGEMGAGRSREELDAMTDAEYFAATAQKETGGMKHE